MSNKVAENVKKIIAERGLKHNAVAERAGYTAQQFSNMLTGRKAILGVDIWRISQALDLTPNDLFGITKPKQTTQNT